MTAAAIDDDLTTAYLNEFGETITYWPAVGDSRSILAIIDREPVESLGIGPSANAPLYHITVANTATGGIDADEINPKLDRLTIPLNPGSTTLIQRRITRKIEADPEFLTLEVR